MFKQCSQQMFLSPILWGTIQVVLYTIFIRKARGICIVWVQHTSHILGCMKCNQQVSGLCLCLCNPSAGVLHIQLWHLQKTDMSEKIQRATMIITELQPLSSKDTLRKLRSGGYWAWNDLSAAFQYLQGVYKKDWEKSFTQADRIGQVQAGQRMDPV